MKTSIANLNYVVPCFCFLFLFFLSAQTFAQTLEDLENKENNYQYCLDQGKNMINCSKAYFAELNDLLFQTNSALLDKMDEPHRMELENAHQEWLEKKEVYFKKVEKEYAPTLYNDQRMMTIDKKANFIKDRIQELLVRLVAIKNQ